MLSPNENAKLDEQLARLRRAKLEISSLFSDLDNMLDQTSSFSQSKRGEGRRNDYSSDDDESLDMLLQVRKHDRNYSSNEDEFDFNLVRKKLLSIKKPTRKPPLPKPSSKIKISPSMPSQAGPRNLPTPIHNNLFLKNLIDNLTSLSLQLQPEQSERYKTATFKEHEYSQSANRGIIKRRGSMSHMQSIVRSGSSAGKRPPWSGEKQRPLSGSTTSLNNKPKTTNPALANPWRPNKKTISRSNSNLYLSSTSSNDLTRSTNFERITTNDIGPGWKTLFKSRTNPDLEIYRDPNPKEYDPNLVTVKRKFKVDPNDVGGGWKPTVGKSSDHLNVYKETEERTVDRNLVTVKRRTNVDPNDVGEGWKPAGKMKEDKLFLHKNEAVSSPYVDPPMAESNVVRKERDVKDVGEGWKPTGKIRSEEVFKHKPFDKTQVKEVPTANIFKPGGAGDEDDSGQKVSWIRLVYLLYNYSI